MGASIEPQLNHLQAELCYQFSNVALLRQAMVHRSYINEVDEPDLESNERLEFLGDALLGSIVAQRLYTAFPDAGEGWMTVARSRLVRNETLGTIGKEIGLGDCLLMGAGIANEGARERLTVLSRALEATFGAVWLDGGEDALRSVITRLLQDQIESLSPDQLQPDSKSKLQHLTQSRNGAKPSYVIVEETGPPHDRSFRAVVEVDGEEMAIGAGRSKQAAEMEAARLALLQLQAETA